jgi:hypothetical protein
MITTTWQPKQKNQRASAAGVFWFSHAVTTFHIPSAILNGTPMRISMLVDILF